MGLVELVVIGAVGGVALATLILVVLWRAVGNAFDWLIYRFGNERAANDVAEKWRGREQ